MHHSGDHKRDLEKVQEEGEKGEEENSEEPLDLTGWKSQENKDGLLEEENTGDGKKMSCCYFGLEDEKDPEDISLACLSPISKHSKQNRKRKKKRKNKSKISFEYKKKKKMRPKAKSKSNECELHFSSESADLRNELVPEDLSLYSKSSGTHSCMSEESDSPSEQVTGAIRDLSLNEHSESPQFSVGNAAKNKCHEESTSDDTRSSLVEQEIKAPVKETFDFLTEQKNFNPNEQRLGQRIEEGDQSIISSLGQKVEAKYTEDSTSSSQLEKTEDSEDQLVPFEISPRSTCKISNNYLVKSSTIRHGSNEREECLRPRPSQSLVMTRKRRIAPSLLEGIIGYKQAKLNMHTITAKTSTSRRMGPINKPSYRNHSSKKSSTCSSSSSSQITVALDIFNPEDRELMSDSSNKEMDQDSAQKLLDASVGEIIWAKLGSTRWWPAIVIWGTDCGQPPAHPGQTWVFWFGDHKISELPRDKLVDFVEEFSSKFSDFAGKMFKRGVVEAIREVAVHAEVEFVEGDSAGMLNWAKNGFRTESSKPNPYAPDIATPISENVSKHLNRIKTQYLQALQSFGSQNSLQPRFSRLEQLENKDSALKKVREGKFRIQDVCIACDSTLVEISTQHPLIEGGLCKQCKNETVETMFAYGEDGTNAYCVICGQAGELLICDNNDCNRCYCTGCIDVLVSPGAHKKVLSTSPWLCYMCHDYDPEINGLIRCKEEWQQNVMQLFQPEKHVHLPPSPEDYKEKRPIRVLSLFDGIGTDQLGINVDAYYASEIDQDAINVSIVQHKLSINQLGRIEDVTDAEVAKLCPIDLVIGGSPCNDLSLVNPARKGLYDPQGTGKLFFDFFRVLKAVQLANKGRHVFWLYENVASMPQEYKSTITRFLQCDPAMIDSKYFSPQNRARYFWGNIPGMYAPLQHHLLHQTISLDSVITPQLNRKAIVEKIRTVTTRSNSLRQGKKCLLPVSMNGGSDVLWVTELEQVFGFPRHYTDAGNIPLGRRQQLLGKAWSVPVIKHLFTPLKNFFKLVPSSLSSPTTISTIVTPIATTGNTVVMPASS
ncbi:DNA (cytosine-5)-methyltransferase 3B-like isoform X2 [Limulus polyphemus]|uniref:DNA (cytosine-5-)-methyltransferase n=1 Tax=Limulus polyphemus TaxID=6850 RepID=A0ABM1SRS2_LIMPO|nr:DNA (cytosine-5)-methyltransferase 3B-like isoform X2 [Limulus polyphemus]